MDYTDNQFGFKAHHSTDLCVYALTEFIEYFKSRSTSVYVAFLDAKSEKSILGFYLKKNNRQANAIIFSKHVVLLV